MDLVEVIKSGDVWVPSATEFRAKDGEVWAQVATCVTGGDEGDEPMVFVNLDFGGLMSPGTAETLAKAILAAAEEARVIEEAQTANVS